MGNGTDRTAVFFDIGDTLASARFTPDGKLDGFAPDPDILDSLERLSQRPGLILGIISNTGDELRATLDAALDAATFPGSSRKLGDFFPDRRLRVYSSDLPPDVRPKPDPSIYNYAAESAELALASCVYVGENGTERHGAEQAGRSAGLPGMHTAPSPNSVEDVLDGIPLRYLLISPGLFADSARVDWRDALARLVVPLGVFGPQGDAVMAIGSARKAVQLDDLGFLVTRLGAPDEPLHSDAYLLRDDLPKEMGVLAGEGGNVRQVFGTEKPPRPFEEGDAGLMGPALTPEDTEALKKKAGSPWNWVLASVDEGLIVALPTVYPTIDQFHFAQALHGHNRKLIPSPGLLKAPSRAAVSPLLPSQGFLVEGGRSLAADEVAALARVDVASMQETLDRFADRTDLGDGRGPVQSRHIWHADNNRAVKAAANEFERLGLKTRLHRFDYGGRPLDNVEAELPGEDSGVGGRTRSPAVVLISAHLDSTAAAQGPTYQPHLHKAPGADDDASGLAAVLVLARVLSDMVKARGRPLRETVRFVLFNAEEQGLVGSQHYAADVAAASVPILAVLQMDMIGYAPDPDANGLRRFEVHTGHEQLDLSPMSEPLARLIARVQPEVAPGLAPPELYTTVDPAAGRSDHASFQNHGYPACVVSEDSFLGGPGPSKPPLNNPYYHKPVDTFVNYDYAAQIARCVGAAALLLADPGSGVPGGLPGVLPMRMAYGTPGKSPVLDDETWRLVKLYSQASGQNRRLILSVLKAALETNE